MSNRLRFVPILLVILWTLSLAGMVVLALHESTPPVILGLYTRQFALVLLAYLGYFIALTVITASILFPASRIASVGPAIARRFNLTPEVKWLGLGLAVPLIGFILFAYQRSDLHEETLTAIAVHIPAVVIGVLAVTGIRSLLIAHGTDQESGIDVSWFQKIESQVARVADWLSVGHRGDAAAILVILLGIVVVMGRPLIAPSLFVHAEDVRALFYLSEHYATQTLRAGKLALWNPYMFSGQPFLSNPQTMSLYPTSLALRLLLPVNLALSWSLAFHFAVAGIGMYALARNLKLPRWIALICATAFMLNGEIAARIFAGHLMVTAAMSWLPVSWLLVKKALNDGKIGYHIAAGLVLAVMVLAGHPAVPAYNLIFLSLYAIWVGIMRWLEHPEWRPVVLIAGRFVAILLLMVGFSAIQLLPSLLLARQASLDSGYNPGSATALFIAWNQLPSLIFVSRKRFFWELIPYLGFLPPLLMPFAFIPEQPRPVTRFLAFVAILALVIAFGQSLGLYTLLYTLFPPFRVLRVPARALVMWVPSMIILGGFGLQAMADRSARHPGLDHLARYVGLALIGGGGLLLGSALYGLSVTAGWTGNLPLPISLGVSLSLMVLVGVTVQFTAGAYLPLSLPRWRSSFLLPGVFALAVLTGFFRPGIQPGYGFALSGGLLFACGGLAVFYIRSDTARLAAIAVVLVVGADMLWYAHYLIIPESPQQAGWVDFPLSTSDIQPDQGRVLVFGSVETITISNLPMIADVSSIGGYDPAKLGRYSAVMKQIPGSLAQREIVEFDSSLSDMRVINFLSAEDIVSIMPLDDPRFPFVKQAQGYYVYRNPDAMPRAQWIDHVEVIPNQEEALAALRDPGFDLSSTVILEQPVSTIPEPGSEPSTLRVVGFDAPSGLLAVEVDAPSAGILVLSEPWYSERRGFIDGEEVPVLKANVAFSAFEVPAGHHRVEMRYVPTSFYQGAAVTGFTVLGSVSLLIGSAIRRR